MDLNQCGAIEFFSYFLSQPGVNITVESQSFHKIIVSTDSDKIFDAVSDLPVVRHTRPSIHATVKSTALNAMINLMENHPEKYDVFSYFLPTCPFVTPEDIKYLAFDILRHRMMLTYEAEAQEVSADEVISQILSKVRVP